MNMDPATATAYGTSAAAFLAAAWGFFQQRKATEAKVVAETAKSDASKTAVDELARSQAELMASIQNNASDWKKQYESVVAETQKYRDYVHEKNKKDTEHMLRLTEENADLRARTDLTPIIDQLKEQGEANRQLSVMLAELAQTMKVLLTTVSKLESIKQS